MHHSPSAGLASNEVTAVAQDETGYIWIGTNNGLQRFDGVRYKTFHSRQNDRTSIPNDVILQVLFDKRKNLWLVTADGKVGIFDTRHFTYHEISVKLKKESFLQHGKKLISDQDGNIILLLLVLVWLHGVKRNKSFRLTIILFLVLQSGMLMTWFNSRAQKNIGSVLMPA
jgi:ligand-binding sensor domain-containing protein